MNESGYCYYLIYKLNSYHLYWIVNVDDNSYNLDKEIKEFKRFTVFLIYKNYEILNNT